MVVIGPTAASSITRQQVTDQLEAVGKKPQGATRTAKHRSAETRPSSPAPQAGEPVNIDEADEVAPKRRGKKAQTHNDPSPNIRESSVPTVVDDAVEVAMTPPRVKKRKGKGRETSVQRILREEEEVRIEEASVEAERVARIQEREKERNAKHLEADRISGLHLEATRIEKARQEELAKERRRKRAELEHRELERAEEAKRDKEKKEKKARKAQQAATAAKAVSTGVSSSKSAPKPKVINLMKPKHAVPPPVFNSSTLSGSNGSKRLAQLLATDPQLSAVSQSRGDISKSGAREVSVFQSVPPTGTLRATQAEQPNPPSSSPAQPAITVHQVPVVKPGGTRRATVAARFVSRGLGRPAHGSYTFPSPPSRIVSSPAAREQSRKASHVPASDTFEEGSSTGTKRKRQ